MENIGVLIIERSDNYPSHIKTQLEKFAKKLQSFCYCPVSDKEYARMESFATQKDLVELVFEILKDYHVPDSDDYGTIFDKVGYWYCIALLSLSDNKNILKFLENLTENLIARKHRDTTLLKRNFQYYANCPNLEGMYRKIKLYFQELNDISPVYELMKLIGMTVPEEVPWRFSFTLTNYVDFKFEKDMSDQEKEQRFDLRVEFHSPYGDGECYKIHFKNYTNLIRTGYVTNNDTSGEIYFPGREVHLPSAPSVMNLKKLLQKLRGYVRLN